MARTTQEKQAAAQAYQQLGYDAQGNDIPLPSPKTWSDRHPNQSAYLETILQGLASTPLGQMAMQGKNLYDQSQQVEYGLDASGIPLSQQVEDPVAGGETVVAKTPQFDLPPDHRPLTSFEQTALPYYNMLPSPPQDNSAPIDHVLKQMPGVPNFAAIKQQALQAYNAFANRNSAQAQEVIIDGLSAAPPPIPTRNPKLPWAR